MMTAPELVTPDTEFSWEDVNSYAEVHGDSFYLFDEVKFRKNFSRVSCAFKSRYPAAEIAYSYKTNYTPAICKIVDELGGYAEVVSEMEYDLARHLGVPGTRIIYNGPYKSPVSLRNALYAGALVNLDSIYDYQNVMRAAADALDRTFAVGIRCNFEAPGCSASRFGLDLDSPEFREVVEGIRNSANVDLAGLHCHFPNRELESFQARANKLVAHAKRLFPSPPAFLDVGGGFYGEMPDSLKQFSKVDPPGFDDYAEEVCGVFQKAYGCSPRPPVLFIEPGTALVADTFRFFTRVISTKTIRGRKIATVAGSIFNISPHARVTHLPVRLMRQTEVLENTGASIYDIAGYTCIENDYLTKGLAGPIEVGDFLEYSNLGSYSIVMKPPFILPNCPVLKTLDGTRKLAVAKRRETGEDIFRTFEGT